jgi:hypothetical protein
MPDLDMLSAAHGQFEAAVKALQASKGDQSLPELESTIRKKLDNFCGVRTYSWTSLVHLPADEELNYSRHLSLEATPPWDEWSESFALHIATSFAGSLGTLCRGTNIVRRQVSPAAKARITRRTASRCPQASALKDGSVELAVMPSETRVGVKAFGRFQPAQKSVLVKCELFLYDSAGAQLLVLEPRSERAIEEVAESDDSVLDDYLQA